MSRKSVSLLLIEIDRPCCLKWLVVVLLKWSASGPNTFFSKARPLSLYWLMLELPVFLLRVSRIKSPTSSHISAPLYSCSSPW